MAVSGDTLDVRYAAHAACAIGRAVPLTLENLPCPQWDAVAAGFDGVSPEQTVAFARRRWPALTFEPLVFRRGRDAVGGALMMVQRLPLRIGAVAIGKWTPVYRGGGDRMAAYRDMVETLIAEYAVRRRMMLCLLPRAHADVQREQHDYLLQRGFVTGSNVPFPDRYIVALDKTGDEHRKHLASKWRYHLNHAEKAGLRFEAAGADSLPVFAALYEAMTRRKKFPDYSAYDTLPALLAMPEAGLRPRLFFVRHGGDVVAGAAIFTAGDTAIYLYGATDDRALALRAGYFLHWHIVAWLKENTRARWYDLGGNDGFHGLHQFKKGFVGKAGAIVPLPPMLHYAERRLPLLLGTGAFALRDALRNLRHRLTVARSDLDKPDMKRDAERRRG